MSGLAETGSPNRVTGANGWIVIGAISAAIAVGCGALGAHFLKEWIPETYSDPVDAAKRLSSWDVAAKYQMFSAIGLILIGLFLNTRRSKLASAAAVMLVIGTCLFSGCLYGWVLLDQKWMVVAPVPLGGMSQIIGWLLLAGAALSSSNRKSSHDKF